MDGQLRLITVHAHPDDESSKGAATMARYVAEGVGVTVVTCTGGERGSVLNPAMDRPEVRADLAGVRRAEMELARSILGVDQEWLGFVDSGFPEGDPPPALPEGAFATLPVEVAAAPLVEVIRRLRPHVVVTYNELGGYPHPDHVMCHKISVEAFEAAGDPDRYPDLGEPWQPLKLYYDVAFPGEKLFALNEAMHARGLPGPYDAWLEGRANRLDPERPITTRIRCDEYFSVRDDALRAHATQVDPGGFWFAVPLTLQREIWPTEDFELARSLVRVTKPESDLFEGIVTTRTPLLSGERVL